MQDLYRPQQQQQQQQQQQKSPQSKQQQQQQQSPGAGKKGHGRQQSLKRWDASDDAELVKDLGTLVVDDDMQVLEC
jgi:hypothetical protein